MDGLIQVMNRWSDEWLRLAWAVVWQSTLLVVLAALVTILLRRSAPAARVWVWQIVAIKLLLMPFWTHAVILPGILEPPGLDGRAASVPVAPVLPRTASLSMEGTETIVQNARDESGRGWIPDGILWPSWLLLAWSAAVAVQIVRLSLQRIRLSRLLWRAAPAGPELQDLVVHLARQMGLRHAPRVLLGDRDGPLFVCGIRRTTLVVPSELPSALQPDRLRQAILHELAHLKRHDLLWGWPIEIARAAYFFHPVVHWVCFRLRLERELACDQLAMALGGRGPDDYIKTLLDVVSHRAGLAPLQGAISAGLEGQATVSFKGASTRIESH